MHLIRRAAFRAASSPSLSFSAKSRSLTTSSSFVLRNNIQATGISPSVFRRFNSNDSSPQSTDGEQSSIRSAIDSASESVSTNASEAAGSVSSGAAAGIAYPPREDRRESRPYGGNRGGDRRPNRYNDRNERAPLPPVEPSASIYIGNLLFDITANDLEREFSQFGSIKSSTIATDPRGLSKGFGYIEFENQAEAAAAIEAKNQSILEGRRLLVNYVVKRARGDQQTNPPSKTLFIGNLAFEMSDADLNKLFRDIRNVIDVRVAIDRRTGQPRGFAHADFVDIESATKAKEVLAGQEVYGRALRVDFSLGPKVARPDRSEGGGSYGGNDRGGYQSRY
ncbi:hypothetical protein BGZ60DRAFT_447930 [Tricladium varicosporioides]|nr:hypothetical protein BGZ60DRAFT_447930 [Hymenoscyphus varicosporioides]